MTSTTHATCPMRRGSIAAWPSWLYSFFSVRIDWPLLFDRQLRGQPSCRGIVDATFLTVPPQWTRWQMANGR